MQHGERDVRDLGDSEEAGSCPLGIPHVPNAKTIAAMREPRRGPRFESVEALMAALHADDAELFGA